MEATTAVAELLLILAIALAIPGPNALTCFAHSGLFGKKSNVALIAGMGIGLVLVELSVGLLVDSFDDNKTALLTLHWIGMLFLGLMAIGMFRFNPNTIKYSGEGGKLGLSVGIGMQFVNGKEWAFVILVMGKFITPLGGGFTGIATIISITFTVCLLAMIAWTFCGDKLSHFFSDPKFGPRVFKVCGTLLTLLWVLFLIKGPVS